MHGNKIRSPGSSGSESSRTREQAGSSHSCSARRERRRKGTHGKEHASAIVSVLPSRRSLCRCRHDDVNDDAHDDSRCKGSAKMQ